MLLFFEYIDPLQALFGYFVVLCAIGVPIAISLGLSTLATIISADTLPIEYMAQVTFTSIDNFPIMAIPSSLPQASSWAREAFRWAAFLCR